MALTIKDSGASTKYMGMAGAGTNTDPYYPCPYLPVSGYTASVTGTSDTTVIAAPGTGLYLYVTSFNVSNSHASSGTFINIKDGTTTVRTLYIGPSQTVALTFPTPIKLTVNTALKFAAETGVTNIRASATGYTAA